MQIRMIEVSGILIQIQEQVGVNSTFLIDLMSAVWFWIDASCLFGFNHVLF